MALNIVHRCKDASLTQELFQELFLLQTLFMAASSLFPIPVMRTNVHIDRVVALVDLQSRSGNPVIFQYLAYPIPSEKNRCRRHEADISLEK